MPTDVAEPTLNWRYLSKVKLDSQFVLHLAASICLTYEMAPIGVSVKLANVPSKANVSL